MKFNTGNCSIYFSIGKPTEMHFSITSFSVAKFLLSAIKTSFQSQNFSFQSTNISHKFPFFSFQSPNSSFQSGNSPFQSQNPTYSHEIAFPVTEIPFLVTKVSLKAKRNSITYDGRKAWADSDFIVLQCFDFGDISAIILKSNGKRQH